MVHKLRASEHVVHFIVLCLCLGPILRSVSVDVSIVVFNDIIVLPLLLASFKFEDEDENEDQVQILLILRMLKSVTVMA